jgi:hypothetical protein
MKELAFRRIVTDLEQSSSMEPSTEEAQATDSRHKQEEEDKKNKMEISAEGDQEPKVLPENEEEIKHLKTQQIQKLT